MLTEKSHDEPAGGKGYLPTDFSGLRRRLAAPSSLDDGDRQRLRELTQRAARVRASGGEYRRVEVSEYVSEVLTTETGA